MTEACEAQETIDGALGEERAPLKVLHVLDDTARGALTARVGALLARLQRRQVRSLVVSIEAYGEATEGIQARSVTVVSLEAPADRGSSPIENLGALMRLRPLLRKADPDLVQSWGPRAERMARAACASLGLPLVATGCPPPPARFSARLADGLLALATPEPLRVLADEDERLLMNERRASRAPVRLIGAAVDVSRARSAPALGTDELPLGLFRIGLALRPGHGAELKRMLEAFRPIAALREDARLVLIGDPDTIELRPWVADLDLAGRVEIRPLPEEPAALLRRLDVLWAHDRPRPDQDLMLRAMAIGLPVVCDHTTGLARDIREIGGALMRDPAWPRQFAEATRELMESEELRAAVARAGRILAEERHGIDRQAEALRAVYDEVAAARRRG